MKKGCFFLVIGGLTFTIGVGSYLYQKYSPEIKKYGKEKLMEIGQNSLEHRINELKFSDYKDSVKVLFSREVAKFKELDVENKISEELNSFIKKFNDFSKDGIIDSLEFYTLKKITQDERSK